MEFYQYSALRRSPAHIRLLTVELGEIDDNVKCTMRHVPPENCRAEKRPISSAPADCHTRGYYLTRCFLTK